MKLVPPAGARAEAKRGLAWRREFKRGGTAVGVARARDIARGAELSPDTVRRMASFFARHEVDKRAKGFRPGEDGYPSAGRIAWALWGGDAGKAWATKAVRSMQTEKARGARKMDLSPSDVHAPAAARAVRKRRRRALAVSISHPVHGSIEVRHMSGGARTVKLGGLCELATTCSDDAGPVWIQIAKVGAFKGHPAGPFEMTPATFDEIVRNFRATSNRRIPIDFEHASETDPTSGSIPTVGAPAQGWIVDLDNRGAAGLWGLVEWGDRAREYIRSGAYRYISPAIRFGSRDRVTGQQIGARLTSAGLTNQPFLDGMAPLAARDAAGDVTMSTFAYSSHEYMPKLRAAMRLPDAATASEMKAHMGRLREMYARCADGAPTMVDGYDLGRDMADLRGAMGVGLATTWDELLDLVEDLIDAAIDRHELEMHPGEAPEIEADDSADGDTTMADEALMRDLETARNDAASLTLKLRDAESEREALRAECATLRDWKAQREEQDLRERVEAAYATYKDAKKLTDADKDAMLRVCKADRAAFDQLYPPVAREHEHLLRRMTDTAAPVERAALRAASAEPVAEPFGATVTRLMRDEKLSYESAFAKAEKIHRAATSGR